MAPWSDGGGCAFERHLRRRLFLMECLLKEHVFTTISEDLGSRWRRGAYSRGVVSREEGSDRSEGSKQLKPMRWLKTFRANLLYGDPGVLNMLSGASGQVPQQADQGFDMCAFRALSPETSGSDVGPRQHEGSDEQCGLVYAAVGVHQGQDDEQCGLLVPTSLDAPATHEERLALTATEAQTTAIAGRVKLPSVPQPVVTRVDALVGSVCCSRICQGKARLQDLLASLPIVMSVSQLGSKDLQESCFLRI